MVTIASSAGSIEVKEDIEPTGRAIGLDVGLKYFYADSFGHVACQSIF
jgi:putative transposase